ncbi:MAG: 2-oxoacid:acceptor oxidoreductase family protein [Proteobacteria bacterium]|nr:2-oxoacid:acceptor oxidoreductase family protein [Pseudomonadota bacterium]MBU1710173.1 2-oxoacid:acceptor oxidoreductase family protein [Pseudomonadota bacterium]
MRLSGSGGQGIILAAVILAEAFGVHDNKYVCQTQSYGPEARGGKSKAEVVVSDHPIDYPKAIKLDFLLAMNQESCDAYFFDFKPNGILLVDSTFVTQIPTSRSVAIPFTRIARDKFKKEIVANMIALGAIGQLCSLISLPKLEKAVLARAPGDTKELNRKALKEGIRAAKKIDLASLPRSINPEEEEEI